MLRSTIGRHLSVQTARLSAMLRNRTQTSRPSGGLCKIALVQREYMLEAVLEKKSLSDGREKRDQAVEAAFRADATKSNILVA